MEPLEKWNGSYSAVLSLVIIPRNLLYESILILVEIRKCQIRFVREAGQWNVGELFFQMEFCNIPSINLSHSITISVLEKKIQNLAMLEYINGRFEALHGNQRNKSHAIPGKWITITLTLLEIL